MSTRSALIFVMDNLDDSSSLFRSLTKSFRRCSRNVFLVSSRSRFLSRPAPEIVLVAVRTSKRKAGDEIWEFCSSSPWTI